MVFLRSFHHCTLCLSLEFDVDMFVADVMFCDGKSGEFFFLKVRRRGIV